MQITKLNPSAVNIREREIFVVLFVSSFFLLNRKGIQYLYIRHKNYSQWMLCISESWTQFDAFRVVDLLLLKEIFKAWTFPLGKKKKNVHGLIVGLSNWIFNSPLIGLEWNRNTTVLQCFCSLSPKSIKKS